MADRAFEQPATSDLICIAPKVLDEVWPHVSVLIDQAYESTDDITPDVLAWLKSGSGLLWIASTDETILAAMTTSVINRRSGKVFRLWAIGGVDISLWLGHLAEIEDYARSLGCVKMCFDGREGWKRVLSEYRPTTIAFEKGL